MTAYDRKLQALVPLAETCHFCTMCDLGFRRAVKGDDSRDPHVFSSMTPRRYMVVGQNPGWNEVIEKVPFVGRAGQTFDREIAKHGFTRSDFYICNTVRCYTRDNSRPTPRNIERCEPFLKMEIALIKPRLVVALGAVAFEQLCPGEPFTGSLRKIVKSQRYDVPVFPIYHPSPLNLSDGQRRAAFEGQIALLCGLVRALRRKHPD